MTDIDDLVARGEYTSDASIKKVVDKLTDWGWLAEYANAGWNLPPAGTDALAMLTGRAAAIIVTATERAECAEAEVAAAHRANIAGLRELEADNAKLREALRELVEIKDLCVETGGVEMGREFRAWDAARAALEQP